LSSRQSLPGQLDHSEKSSKIINNAIKLQPSNNEASLNLDPCFNQNHEGSFFNSLPLTKSQLAVQYPAQDPQIGLPRHLCIRTGFQIIVPSRFSTVPQNIPGVSDRNHNFFVPHNEDEKQFLGQLQKASASAQE
jgi:hypothetical protein